MTTTRVGETKVRLKQLSSVRLQSCAAVNLLFHYSFSGAGTLHFPKPHFKLWYGVYYGVFLRCFWPKRVLELFHWSWEILFVCALHDLAVALLYVVITSSRDW
jgi:hypothetical protein